MNLPPLTLDAAPEASRPILEKTAKGAGFLPNIYAIMGHSPALLTAYDATLAAFSASGFSATELQIIMMTASADNDCRYCVAAHSTVARRQKVPEDVIVAIRQGHPIADPKLEALRRFTHEMVIRRGKASEAARAGFLAAGYSEAQALAVVAGIAAKVMTNYANALAGTPLEAIYEKDAWSPPADAAA